MTHKTGHGHAGSRRRVGADTQCRSTRRALLLALVGGALAQTPLSFAQPRPVRRPVIGFLGSTSASGSASWVEALRRGLSDLGYVVGRNIVIEYRWADGKYERLPGLASELVKMKVDIIVASPTPAIQAARQATSTIPIVMVAVPDPVRAGFVASLSRPGGNITGLSNINVDLSSKYLELLGAAVPRLARAVVLTNPSHPNHPDYSKSIQASAKTAGVKISMIEAQSESQIESGIGAIMRERPDAIIVLPDPFFLTQARQIAALAIKYRVATMFWTRQLAEAGGLMSYGQDLVEHFRRAATYVDKILKGAKPGELPVEQPMKLELIVNRKTAGALGLTISNELLLRADRVIE